MKKKAAYIITALFIGAIYGISIHKYHVFPYEFIAKFYELFSKENNSYEKNNNSKENNSYEENNNSVEEGIDYNYGPWAIGIYSGTSPFDLSDAEQTSNPVLRAEDVNDINAQFIADPFMVVEDSSYYLFFEILNKENSQGDIGCAESKDGVNWTYKHVVLDEKFHLSYPHVFKWQNNYYMVPESGEDLSVRIYRAVSFPDKWEYIGNLLSGFRFVDPTIFRYKNKWWMYVSNIYNDALNLFYSDDLFKGWKAHPVNPIVKFDMSIARPGGSVIEYNGSLYRFAQDDDPDYGIQVFAFKITELSETVYKEKPADKNPVIKMSGKGWNANGMHHVDLHKVGKRWIAAVDGRNY